MAVPALPRARARVPQGRAGEVVPERPDRARERAGARDGTLRALRRRGRVAAHGAVVLPDHRLRAGAPRRPRDRRLAGVDQGAPAQLDRPLGGRGDPVPDRGARTRTSPSSRPVPTRSTARPSSSSRPSTSSSRASTPTRFATTCAGPSAKKTAERAAATEKTGVFTGLHAVNPVNGERLPVYVADYVLTDYGTGAIMAVPAHDQRDFDFATAFDLPIRQVVRPPDGEVDESVGVRRARGGRGARQLGASSTGCRRRRAAAGSSRSSRPRVAGASRSTTACATGASRASATGAARSRSSTATRAGSSRCPRTSCRSCSPRSRTTSRRACRRSRRRRTG